MAETNLASKDPPDTLSQPLLLTTKLYRPPVRANLVSRPRLIQRLDEGLTRKLTFISAPAGFGKTTLLSEWIPHSRWCVTWVSLDNGDNDSTRFWSYFVAGLQQLTPKLGQNALSLFQSPQPPPLEVCLTTLLNEIATFPEPFAFVLDDYHAIENPTLHEAVTFLLDHLPSQLHLIIITRADPPLPLSRLRSREQLIELRTEDLRFTPAEAMAFFNQVMGLNLSRDDVAALEVHTEGWIAGLQLAALSMQGRDDLPDFIAAFTGSHRFILDYLTDEVLERRPKGTQNFLLQTSILDRLCGPLCDALSGDSGGQTTLERLEQANLFIVPLDDHRRWYRYHQLFAEVLRARLQQVQPDIVPELHRRAWEWLEQNGLTPEAVNHALAGRDFEQAARLIELVHSTKWQTGEIKTLQGWLAALPEASWRTHPRLWLVQAWADMTVGEFSKADEKLRGAEEALALLDDESARNLSPEVLAFRASYASLVQDPRAVELAQHALQELPEEYWLRGMLVVFLGAAYYGVGDLDSASNVLALAPGSSLSTPGTQPHQIHLLAFGGMVHHAKGKLHDAWLRIRQALELAEPGGKPILFVGTLLAYMAASFVLYEQGELDQAEANLTRCETQAVKFGSAEVQLFALSGLARISLARDDLTAAVNYSNQVDALLQEHAFTISIYGLHRILSLPTAAEAGKPHRRCGLG
jgi:LuxR family maltose regulon positive regulatory protein